MNAFNFGVLMNEEPKFFSFPKDLPSFNDFDSNPFQANQEPDFEEEFESWLDFVDTPMQ